jgi:hypothetical protein
MDETAQIILATGVALGIILFALKGNLDVILARGERKARAAVDRSFCGSGGFLLLFADPPCQGFSVC